MKNKNVVFIILSIIAVIFVFVIVKEVIPIINERDSKNRILNDMQDKSDNVIRGIVGIIPENDTNGLTNHNGVGSGVIFDKKDNTYYVVTAKHVVNIKNSKFKIFTKDTEFSGQTIKADDNVNFEIPDDDYYDSLLDGKIEYISDTTDLAILSFEYDDDLTVLDFESHKLSKNDKIMVIGHPEGNRYQISYGYIKSDLKNIRGNKVIEHNAYMRHGNSGGVALTENMKIAGINIAGSFTLLGHYKVGYMIPYDIVKENINIFNASKESSKNLDLSNGQLNNWSENKVTMNVKEVSKDKTCAILVIEDKNDIPISWNTYYSIQRLSEADVWYDLKSNTTVEQLMKIMVPNENGITEIELDWSNMYGELKNGTYRIVKNKDFITLYSEPFKIK